MTFVITTLYATKHTMTFAITTLYATTHAMTLAITMFSTTRITHAQTLTNNKHKQAENKH